MISDCQVPGQRRGTKTRETHAGHEVVKRPQKHRHHQARETQGPPPNTMESHLLPEAVHVCGRRCFREQGACGGGQINFVLFFVVVVVARMATLPRATLSSRRLHGFFASSPFRRGDTRSRDVRSDGRCGCSAGECKRDKSGNGSADWRAEIGKRGGRFETRQDNGNTTRQDEQVMIYPDQKEDFSALRPSETHPASSWSTANA